MITGAIRTISINVTEMLSDLPALCTVVKAAPLTVAYHLRRPDHMPWK